MKHMKKRIIGYAALAMACVMLGASLPAVVSNHAAADETVVTTVVTSPFTAAIAMVKNSVVGVNNYKLVRSSSRGYGSDWYGFGFGFGFPYGYGSPYGRGNDDQDNEPREALSVTGSGVVIADKYVLTNYHVVDGASSLKVSISHDDGTEPETLDAVLVTYDETLDVAVLKCEELTLAPVTLGDSDKLVVGDWAICIGNPLSSDLFSGTVTAGIVSGLNRNVSSKTTTADKYGRRTATSNTMIQIDAAINSGNSGGGMFSVTGELMGIPTIKYSGSSNSGSDIDGIGMCIPINSCKDLIETALSTKLTDEKDEEAPAAADKGMDMTGRPRMGLTMATLSSQNSSLSYAVRYASYYGMIPSGVYVSAVDENGPAAQAGIQPGDIIVDMNDTIITSSAQVQNLVAAHKAGDELQVKVYRVPGITELGDTTVIPDGEYIDLKVTLAVVDPVS